MNRRVVITGMGIFSCIGQTLDTVKKSLYQGVSGIGIIQERYQYGYHCALSGILPQPNLKGELDRRQRIGLSQEAEFAYLSTRDALKDAEIDDNYLLKNNIGIIFGNDSSADAIIKTSNIMNEKHDTAMLGSGSVFQSMNSTITMNLSTIFHIKGINFTISSACASGNHSIGVASTFIKTGMQDVIICGGAQEVNINSSTSFDALGVFSKYKGDPTKASRPFDKNRDGLIPSGGSATIILEELEHAQKRGAKIYGEILGYGFSSNGGKISAPGSDGSQIAIEMALKNGGIKPQEINYINAHATSTPEGDLAEAKSLIKIFGENMPPISSTKSMTGHECWMAGVSEAIYSTLMMNNSFIAPNINYEIGDEYTQKLNIATSTINTKIDKILSNSFGFGGTNAVIIISNYLG